MGQRRNQSIGGRQTAATIEFAINGRSLKTAKKFPRTKGFPALLLKSLYKEQTSTIVFVR